MFSIKLVNDIFQSYKHEFKHEYQVNSEIMT